MTISEVRRDGRVPRAAVLPGLAFLASLVLPSAALGQATITDISVSEATVASVFDITGTGFGTEKPKVFFAESGAKVKGTGLKVLQFSDTMLTVRVKKAIRGTFTVVVNPKGDDPVESVDTVEIVPPAVVAVDTENRQPGQEATATVEWLSDAKIGVAMGGLEADVTSVELAVGGAAPTWIVNFEIPKKLPSGTWAVEVTNPIGTVSSSDGITVVGGAAKLGKPVVRVVMEGSKPLQSKDITVLSSAEGPTTVTAAKKSMTCSLTLPFVYGTNTAPLGYDADTAEFHFVDMKTGEEYLSDSDLSVLVSAARDGRVAGSFSGIIHSVTAGSESRLVSGSFVYDGNYELDDTPGLTNSVLVAGQVAPPIHVQILDVDGATGPGGNFQPADSVKVKFRLAKDDGTVWKLSEMSLARAMISGPTFNYQRVITQQTNVSATSKDNGDGSYTYTFPPLPDTYVEPYNDTDSFDSTDGELTGQPLMDGTYTLALWFRWSYSVDGEGFNEVGERTFDFLIGDTPQPLIAREVVSTDACNRCHTELQAHGGSRRTSELCVMCHTQGAEDRNTNGATPGASIAWNIMIHKIHNGAHLPSVLGVTTDPGGARNYAATPEPYQLVGFGNSVHDYSEVHFPAWPNLEAPMPRDMGYSALTSGQQGLETEMLSGVTSCYLCHGDPDGDEGPIEAPSQGDLAYTNPTRNACGACHDDWVFEELYTSNGQTMPAQFDDDNCAFCHDASGNGLAVQDAHLHPLLDSSVVSGLHFALTSVAEAGTSNMDGTIDPGEKVAVSFTITDDNGTQVDPATLDRHNVMISGPSSNLNVMTPEMSLPAEMLTGGQPFTVNVPMVVYLEEAGVATAGADAFSTAFTPHWNATGAATTVWEVTGATGGGGSSTLSDAVVTPINYIDVVNGANFDRDDFIVIAGVGGNDYLQIQTVEGNRLWFSSPYTPNYPVGPQFDHTAGTVVLEIDVTPLTEGVEYTLTEATGTITENGGAFTDGNAIITTYTTDFVMPATYGLALNAGPDLTEFSGTWAGKSLVSGTYSLGMWGHINRTFTEFGESQTYRDGAMGERIEFLVGDANTIEPWENISDPANCYACHVDIQFHGSNRRGFDACLMCHGTAGAGDRPQYVAPNAPATDGLTVNFRQMLHKIHTGADLDNADTYQVIGFGQGYPNNFSIHTYEEVHFPTMPSGTKNCVACHGDTSTTWYEPDPREHPTEQVLAVKEWTTVCGGCHDDDVAQAHIETQSSPTTGAEACAVCHGTGQTWAVNLMHVVR